MSLNRSQLHKDTKASRKQPTVKTPKDNVSKMGYRDDSPYRNKPYLDINTPNGMIDMSGTGIPIMANGVFLAPYSGQHQFNTNTVREVPVRQQGGDVRIEDMTPEQMALWQDQMELATLTQRLQRNADDFGGTPATTYNRYYKDPNGRAHKAELVAPERRSRPFRNDTNIDPFYGDAGWFERNARFNEDRGLAAIPADDRRLTKMYNEQNFNYPTNTGYAAGADFGHSEIDTKFNFRYGTDSEHTAPYYQTPEMPLRGLPTSEHTMPEYKGENVEAEVSKAGNLTKVSKNSSPREGNFGTVYWGDEGMRNIANQEEYDTLLKALNDDSGLTFKNYYPESDEAVSTLQQGGEVLELTEAEIAEYKKQGYVVEDVEEDYFMNYLNNKNS